MYTSPQRGFDIWTRPGLIFQSYCNDRNLRKQARRFNCESRRRGRSSQQSQPTLQFLKDTLHDIRLHAAGLDSLSSFMFVSLTAATARIMTRPDQRCWHGQPNQRASTRAFGYVTGRSKRLDASLDFFPVSYNFMENGTGQGLAA